MKKKRVLISAHRSGAELDRAAENRKPTLESAAAQGFDFVEFDVQRCKDGVFVLFHDDVVVIDGRVNRVDSLTFGELVGVVGEIVTLDEAVSILQGRTKAHVDFKFVSPDALYATPERTYEVDATRLVVDVMGVENCIITTMEDESVRAVRAWSRVEYPELLVGLSLGRSLLTYPWYKKVSIWLSEVFAERRLKACDANLIVSKKSLARLRLANLAERMGVPLLVWTLDSDEELQYWLHDDRAWLVTTDFWCRVSLLTLFVVECEYRKESVF